MALTLNLVPNLNPTTVLILTPTMISSPEHHHLAPIASRPSPDLPNRPQDPTHFNQPVFFTLVLSKIGRTESCADATPKQVRNRPSYPHPHPDPDPDSSNAPIGNQGAPQPGSPSPMSSSSPPSAAGGPRWTPHWPRATLILRRNGLLQNFFLPF